MSQIPSLEVVTSVSNTLDTDIVAVFQDAGKKAIPPNGKYRESVEKLRKLGSFSGNHGSIQFIRFAGKEPAENVLFVGMGNAADLTEEKVRAAGGSVSTRLKAEKCIRASLDSETLLGGKGLKEDLNSVRLIRAFTEGYVMSPYSFQKYKSKKNSDEETNEIKAPKLLVTCQDRKQKVELEKQLAQVAAVAESVQLTRDWSNEPSNFGTPEYYAEEARKWGKKLGLKVTVWNEREAAREKMGLFLGVGQGGERESQLVIMEYTPSSKDKKNAKTIALVGKGVTFDSGGISIKPSLRMEDMKHDMTGAATVMGAITLAARWKVPNRVVANMAFVEHMPDGNAIQPGNILKARNGKTVEIINTDAEGRLILADALDVVQDYKPDAVVDVATLTGAVSVALGKHSCAILGNEQTLIDALCRSGATNGERIWQLPLYDEYLEDLKSDCADLKNSANDSNGGTIRGAIFLKQFIRKNVQWAHLDIASTAYNMGHISYYPKRGASGAYVRTLAQFVSDF